MIFDTGKINGLIVKELMVWELKDKIMWIFSYKYKQNHCFNPIYNNWIILEFISSIFFQEFGMKTVSSVTYFVFIMVVVLSLLLIQTDGYNSQSIDYNFCVSCVIYGCNTYEWVRTCFTCK